MTRPFANGAGGIADKLAATNARIARAIAAMDEAPDPPSDEASKRQASAIHAANRVAHAILTEGRDPPSQRVARGGGAASRNPAYRTEGNDA